MMLTKEQADEALKAINSFGTKPCPYCGSTNGFEFDDQPFDMISVSDLAEAIQSNSTTVPTLPVLAGFCKVCGYTISFNIHKLIHRP